MQNVVKEATRVTPTTQSLIDLIVTTKTELVRKTGVLPLGISDHSLIHATLRLTSKIPPPKVIKIRNFKHFNADNFKADIKCAPFHVATVFDDKYDILWAWKQLFKGICGTHAPYREVKVRSQSSPWINSAQRLKMNRSRFRLQN